MKSLKIKSAGFDNRKKLLIIKIPKCEMTLPYQWLEEKPNKILEAYPEKEINNEGVTYITEDGTKNTVHIDLFLNYNQDPEYVRQENLYKLSVQIQKAVKESGLSIHEISRRMKTSRMQVMRLLDQTNTKKTFDSLFKLAFVIGSEVSLELQKRVS